MKTIVEIKQDVLPKVSDDVKPYLENLLKELGKYELSHERDPERFPITKEVLESFNALDISIEPLGIENPKGINIKAVMTAKQILMEIAEQRYSLK